MKDAPLTLYVVDDDEALRDEQSRCRGADTAAGPCDDRDLHAPTLPE